MTVFLDVYVDRAPDCNSFSPECVVAEQVVVIFVYRRITAIRRRA